MKELSIEQKAKHYDEALERMKAWVKGEYPECFTEAQKTAEFIFPELKESEDERIKKAIMEFFELQDDNTTYSFIPKKDILTWLEKQCKEHVWTDNDRTMAFTLLRDVEQMTHLSNKGKNERLEWLNTLEDRFKEE